MLHYFYEALLPYWGGFNVLRYLTFRAAMAVITALLISFIVGPPLIRWLRCKQKEGQPIRADGPASHLVTKKGTPTMGGVLILLSMLLSTLIWADLSNHLVWVVLLVGTGYGALGAWDDYTKLTKRSSKGVSGRMKLLLQISIALMALVCWQQYADPALLTDVHIPFLKHTAIYLGPFFLLWAIFVIVGSSNAVNLTDGLDGLAIAPIMIAAMCFAIICYVVGNQVFAGYLKLRYVGGTGELAIICAALVGAGLGFLWYNAPPAQVFMGDTGSLAAGGLLGTMSVVAKHELVLAIVGGLFVLETFSVMIQVMYYKWTGKRIFLMAPIHHHFEQKGWAEATIVIRFWIIATVLALVGLSTLKLR